MQKRSTSWSNIRCWDATGWRISEIVRKDSAHHQTRLRADERLPGGYVENVRNVSLVGLRT